ncbi:hypothetical protein BGZ59_004922, partial [Podila verticillata]
SVVHVPYIPDEPIYFVLERTKLFGRKLFVDGISLEDISQLLDRHRILDNGFSYSCHPHRKIWCLCEQPPSASPFSSTVTQMTPSSTS